MVKKIELLAPAKDLECGKLAITCGADAVYIGAAKFSARSAAGNTIDDIRQLADFAHLYNAKVYAAVNTILRDDELADAVKLTHELFAAGVDGLIIQDVGLLECDLPPLPIIASTQMHNNTPEKVKFLQDIGFKRAILARELSLKEISAIAKNAPKIELEAFVHGALCVCYSGQCYLSCAMGRRSGNRGVCAQPCRKKYELVDERGNVLASAKHLLSPRDLNLSNRLSDLLDVGITSFKIEGRLKDSTYIANVVSAYRGLLDIEIKKRGWSRISSGKSTIDFIPDLNKTFNREYTEYFIDGTGNKVGGINTPKNRGELIGRVENIIRNELYITTDQQLQNGDGLSWFDSNGDLTGGFINNVYIEPSSPVFSGIKKYRLKLKNLEELKPDTEIYRNYDIKFTNEIEKSNPNRKVNAVIEIASDNDVLSVTARDEEGNSAEIAHEFTELANNVDNAKNMLLQSFAKSGDTIFDCAVNIEGLQTIPFMKVAQINALRRELLEKLHDERLKNYKRDIGGINANNYPYPASSIDYRGNILNLKAKEFYQRHGVLNVSDAAESGLNMQNCHVMRTRYCIRKELGICLKNGNPAKKLYLRDENYEMLELKFDCANCEMNVIYLGRK
ncbi:MAG: U32 family peptidase [bacterium]